MRTLIDACIVSCRAATALLVDHEVQQARLVFLHLPDVDLPNALLCGQLCVLSCRQTAVKLDRDLSTVVLLWHYGMLHSRYDAPWPTDINKMLRSCLYGLLHCRYVQSKADRQQTALR